MLFLPPKITGLVGATLLLSAYSISAQSTTELNPATRQKLKRQLLNRKLRLMT